MHSPSSPGPRQLPSGAVAIGPWTIAARPGRVYLSVDPAADGDLSTGAAYEMAAAIHHAAGLAERTAVELAALTDTPPVPAGREPTPAEVIA
jgi:hypothetical protein